MTSFRNRFYSSGVLLQLALLCFLSLSCTSHKGDKKVENEQITIFIQSAAGARSATDKIADLYEKKVTHCKVQRNYASSGLLARQIANGAPCDIFISASREWMDFLVNEGFIVADSVHQLGGNSLVIIAPLNSEIKAPEFTPDFDISTCITDKIVIGDPSYVPVGKYTRMAFDTLKWFPEIEAKTILAKDVSSVLHYVELGECDWGVVYRSEAILSSKVKIIAEIPSALHEPIVFYVASMMEQKSEAKALTALFLSNEGTQVLKELGFYTVSETGNR